MGHKTFKITGAVGGEINLATELGALMGEEFASGVVSVTMYDSAALDNAVTPSAGTLTVTASEDNFNFGTIDDNVVDLTDPAYLRPSWRALVTNLKFNWAGVTGATHYEIRVWRHTD